MPLDRKRVLSILVFFYLTYPSSLYLGSRSVYHPVYLLYFNLKL
jgi:hypothetical protein